MSIKFPKLYKAAAEILKKASEEDINVKNILYNEKKYRHNNIKSVYAIVAKALENWNIIETLIKETNILTEHRGLNPWRIRVIISELVFDKKCFENPKNYTLMTVIQYEKQFKEILARKNFKELIGSNAKSEIDVVKVRFIRVNTIKDNVKSVIEWFQEESWEKLETASKYEDYLEQLKNLEPHSPVFLQDFHIPQVLVFPPGTELQYHQLYVNGSIFLMDKASCLPPFLLAPKCNSHVLDMCAAPGLKTIQLASYASSGKVYAVEKDIKRYNDLEKMVEQSGADNVIKIFNDVTKLDVDDYNHVEYILVDPSCTGSGIRKRFPSATLKDRLKEKTRLEKLSGFQVTLLRFAFTRFPAAKRIVYSTCSLNLEENEKVVEDALSSQHHNFDIVSVKNKLPGWQNFGSKDFKFGSKCVYCQPEIDQTNGFFVAVFERKERQSDSFYIKNHSECGGNQIPMTSRKRRINGENFDGENKRLKIDSHKKGKHEVNKERNLIGEVSTYKRSDKGEPPDIGAKGKKLSLSEKKRSRKKILKLKKKLLPKSKKNKTANVKVNCNVSDNLVNTSEKKQSSENCDKISKAKSRYMRLKKLKMKSKQLVEGRNVSLNNKNKIKEDTTTLKEGEKSKSKHFDGRKMSVKLIEKNPCKEDITNESMNRIESIIVESNESKKKSKKKHKKNHSLETESSHDINNEGYSGTENNFKYQTHEKQQKQKLKNEKEHVLDLYETDLNGSTKSNECRDEKNLKNIKQKKKHSLSNNYCNDTHEENKIIDKSGKVVIHDKCFEEVYPNTSEERDIPTKKRKKIKSSESKSKIAENVHDDSLVIEGKTIETGSDVWEDTKKLKKKHKKTRSSEQKEISVLDTNNQDGIFDKFPVENNSNNLTGEILIKSSKTASLKKKHKKISL